MIINFKENKSDKTDENNKMKNLIELIEKEREKNYHFSYEEKNDSSQNNEKITTQ